MAGNFDPVGRGERRILWDALGDIEFFWPWPESEGEALTANRAGTRIAPVALGSSLLDQPASGRTQESASETSLFNLQEVLPLPVPGIPFQALGQRDALAVWLRMLYERHAPQRWTSIDSPSDSRLGSAVRKPGTALHFSSVSQPAFHRQSEGNLSTDRSFFVPMVRENVMPHHRSSRDPYVSSMERGFQERLAMSFGGFFRTVFAASRAQAGPPKDETDARPIPRPGNFPKATLQFLVSQSQGAPLGVFQRLLLEPFFPGMNLAEVRIHHDEAADRAAGSLKSDAFSLGPDIYFRAARFDPSKPRGLALLVHELEHTRQVINGEPFQTTLQRRELEQKAEAVETSFLRASIMSGTLQPEQPAAAWKDVGNPYGPVRLEPARPLAYWTQGSGDAGRGSQRSISLSALSGEATRSQPLKAEENRPAATGAANASASAPEDQEGLTRALLRTLERKVRTEKERRGVDRWEN
jgi:hypothetical protein